MRVLFDNVQFNSTTGPNSFASKLAYELTNLGHLIVTHDQFPDVQLSFIQSTTNAAPVVQRLDGIWFNSKQQWQQQNKTLHETYSTAHSIICQSNFDKKLVEKFFGAKDSAINVINNGINIDSIISIDPLYVPTLRGIDKVWSCAASWRPHKRLKENIRYFFEHAGQNDCLVIAGDNPDVRVADKRVFYTGNLDERTLYSLYRASDYFLHLAYLDHCPNTVVAARAAGCHIICSSSGGTEEIAGLNSTIIEENEWDFEPCDLYNPPEMDFSRKRQGRYDNNIDIVDVAKKYEVILRAASGIV